MYRPGGQTRRLCYMLSNAAQLSRPVLSTPARKFSSCSLPLGLTYLYLSRADFYPHRSKKLTRLIIPVQPEACYLSNAGQVRESRFEKPHRLGKIEVSILP
jgi:hypothetical protein